MSALTARTRSIDEHAHAIRFASTCSGLGVICEGSAELVVWDRPEPDYLQWIRELPEAQLPRLRWRGTPGQASAAIAAACEACGTPDGIDRTCFLLDVAALASTMAELGGTSEIEIRLDVTQGQPCPRWHRDAVTMRLLSTLRGPGTEFGVGSQHQEPCDIWRLGAGEVGLLRGTGGSGGPLHLVHRSPPAIDGATRLLLVIDPAERETVLGPTGS